MSSDLEKSITAGVKRNKLANGSKPKKTQAASAPSVPKQKSKRVLRILADKDPKVNENIKTAMFVKGSNSSQIINDVMKDLALLKKPDVISMKKKNEKLRPFEEPTSIEFFSQRNDASLFVFGSHTKKRPQNLIFGRLFDYHILDMIEVGVQNYKGMREFSGDKSSVGNKPCFIFIGEEFEQKEELKRFSNLLLDFFRGAVVDTVNLAGLEHVIVCTSAGDNVYFRTYRVVLKKSGSKIPRVELNEMGPSLDFVLRRTTMASNDLMREAVRVPKELKPKKVKNITKDSFGQMGRVHMPRQDLQEMATRKMRAFKRKPEDKEDNNSAKKQKE